MLAVAAAELNPPIVLSKAAAHRRSARGCRARDPRTRGRDGTGSSPRSAAPGEQVDHEPAAAGAGHDAVSRIAAVEVQAVRGRSRRGTAGGRACTRTGRPGGTSGPMTRRRPTRPARTAPLAPARARTRVEQAEGPVVLDRHRVVRLGCGCVSGSVKSARQPFIAGRQWAAVSSSIVIGASRGTDRKLGDDELLAPRRSQDDLDPGERGDASRERARGDDHRGGRDVTARRSNARHPVSIDARSR